MARCLAVLVGGITLLGSATVASASHASDAWTEPESLQAGEDLVLVFEVGSPDVAEVVAQERIDCTVTRPDGSQVSPCERPGPTVDVRMGGDDARTYVFAYQAPDQVGNYEVAFQADATARALPHDHQATTTFTVSSVDEPRQSSAGDDPAVDPPDEPDDPESAEDPRREDPGDERSDASGEGNAGADLASVDADQARLTTSLTVATSVLAGATVFARTDRW